MSRFNIATKASISKNLGSFNALVNSYLISSLSFQSRIRAFFIAHSVVAFASLDGFSIPLQNSRHLEEQS